MTTGLMTSADLAALPEDDRGELIDGVMVPISPLRRDQSCVAANVMQHVWAIVGPTRLGRVGPRRGFTLRRNPDTVLAPDVSYVSWERDVPDDDATGFAALSPDLAVETVSPTDTFEDLDRRIGIYLAAGVPLLWIVCTMTRSVTAYVPDGRARRLGMGDVLDGGEVLPGFALPLADLFDLD